MSGEIIYLNGQFLPKADAAISPDDRGFLFGDGVYEVIRSYGGVPFALDAHLARLANGLATLRIEGIDAAAFADVARTLLADNGYVNADALVYLQVTRGAGPRRHWFPDPDTPPTTYGAAFPFRGRGDPTRGIAVITVPDVRWARCDIKTVNLLANCLASQAAQDAGVDDAVMVRDGVALEASSSSFFGVFDGEVRTAPKSNYILPSITRAIALDLCRELAIPRREAPIFVEDLGRADELFLAGTTLEIMPVTTINGRPVGNGQPGPLTRRLAERFGSRTGATQASGV